MPSTAYKGRIFPLILRRFRPNHFNSTYIGHVERVPESEWGLGADLSAEVAGEGGGGTSNVGRGGKGSGASGEGESDNGLHRFGIIGGYYRAGNCQ